MGSLISKNKTEEQNGESQRSTVIAGDHSGKVFEGIRVIDFATHIAAPSVGRVFGDLGAEVIKVESPQGDLFRRTLVDFEKPRKYGTPWETQNVSKYGCVLDVKQPEGLEALKKLMREADVILVNTRQKALQKLCLDYESVKAVAPQIVYAQISAWGLKGPDAGLPGYDLGAFWTATGLAVSVNVPGQYSTYPGALGDQCTAQFLFSAIQMALIERMKTGKGKMVHVSLIHCGTWCLAPVLLNKKPLQSDQAPNYDERPPKKILDQIYGLKSEEPVAICYKGSFSDEEQAEMELLACLGLNETSTHGEVASAISQMNKEELSTKISGTKLLEMTEYINIAELGSEFEDELRDPAFRKQESAIEPSPDGFEGISFLPRLPYELTCSEKHGSFKAGFSVGQHTKDILEKGWFNSAFPWPALEAESDVLSKPLQGVKIIEVTDVRMRHDVCVAAAGRVLADAGANVVKIPAGGVEDSLRSANSVLFEHLNGCKEEKNETDLDSLLTDASLRAIITDCGLSELKRLGIDAEALQTKAKHVIVVQLLPDLKSSPERPFTLLGSGFLRTGLGNILGGTPALDIPRFPEHVLESVSSAFFLAGTLSGIFHSLRTGSGQHVKISYQRIGVWLAQVNSVFIMRNKNMLNVATMDKHNRKRTSPLPCYMSHVTKDGIWVQLLGLDTKRHVPRILDALGVKWRVVRKVVAALLTEVRFSEKELIKKLEPLFVVINDEIAEQFSRRTFAELKEVFGEHDVWHTVIRMPEQLLSYQQVWDNGILSKNGKTIEINSPIQFT